MSNNKQAAGSWKHSHLYSGCPPKKILNKIKLTNKQIKTRFTKVTIKGSTLHEALCLKDSNHYPERALWLYHQNTHKYTLELRWKPGFHWNTTQAATPTQPNRGDPESLTSSSSSSSSLNPLCLTSLKWPVSVQRAPVRLGCCTNQTTQALSPHS